MAENLLRYNFYSVNTGSLNKDSSITWNKLNGPGPGIPVSTPNDSNRIKSENIRADVDNLLSELTTSVVQKDDQIGNENGFKVLSDLFLFLGNFSREKEYILLENFIKLKEEEEQKKYMPLLKTLYGEDMLSSGQYLKLKSGDTTTGRFLQSVFYGDDIYDGKANNGKSSSKADFLVVMTSSLMQQVAHAKTNGLELTPDSFYEGKLNRSAFDIPYTVQWTAKEIIILFKKEDYGNGLNLTKKDGVAKLLKNDPTIIEDILKTLFEEGQQENEFFPFDKTAMEKALAEYGAGLELNIDNIKSSLINIFGAMVMSKVYERDSSIKNGQALFTINEKIFRAIFPNPTARTNPDLIEIQTKKEGIDLELSFILASANRMYSTIGDYKSYWGFKIDFDLFNKSLGAKFTFEGARKTAVKGVKSPDATQMTFEECKQLFDDIIKDCITGYNSWGAAKRLREINQDGTLSYWETNSKIRDSFFNALGKTESEQYKALKDLLAQSKASGALGVGYIMENMLNAMFQQMGIAFRFQADPAGNFWTTQGAEVDESSGVQYNADLTSAFGGIQSKAFNANTIGQTFNVSLYEDQDIKLLNNFEALDKYMVKENAQKLWYLIKNASFINTFTSDKGINGDTYITIDNIYEVLAYYLPSFFRFMYTQKIKETMSKSIDYAILFFDISHTIVPMSVILYEYGKKFKEAESSGKLNSLLRQTFEAGVFESVEKERSNPKEGKSNTKIVKKFIEGDENFPPYLELTPEEAQENNFLAATVKYDNQRLNLNFGYKFKGYKVKISDIMDVSDIAVDPFVRGK